EFRLQEVSQFLAGRCKVRPVVCGDDAFRNRWRPGVKNSGDHNGHHQTRGRAENSQAAENGRDKREYGQSPDSETLHADRPLIVAGSSAPNALAFNVIAFERPDPLESHQAREVVERVEFSAPRLAGALGAELAVDGA